MNGEWKEGCTTTAGQPPGHSVGLAALLGTFAVVLLTAAAPTHAGELIDLDVYENGGTFHVHLDMVIHADPSHVRAVLTDYAHVYRLSPTIVESEILPSPARESVRVRTRVEECVAFFCFDLVSVADLREQPSGDLRAAIIPELSSFRSGTAEWRIRSEQGISRVVYESTMDPDFFVPPVVGRHIVIKKLAKETLRTFFRLECLAQAHAQRESGDYARDASLRGGRSCEDGG